MRSVNNPQTFHTTQSYYQPSVQVGQQQTQNQPTYLQAKQTQQNIQSPSHLIGRPSNQHMKEEPMRQQQMKE